MEQEKFLNLVPVAEHPLLKGAKHDEQIWLFIGANPEARVKERKRQRHSPLAGRPEHVDDVDHDGTWHVQLCGTKTWYVKPNLDAEDWEGVTPELRAGAAGSVKGARGGLRARVHTEAGDILLINTRAWWHRTELEAGPDLSISYARDLYLGGADGCASLLATPVFALANFEEGSVVLEEDAIPDELERDPDPNCAMAEVEVEDDPEEDGTIVLVALRDVEKGERLTVAPDPPMNWSDKVEGASNTGVVDPRCIASRTYLEGELIMEEDDIPPEGLPVSLEPNAEGKEDESGRYQVMATRNVEAGEIIMLGPQEGVEYDEHELGEDGQWKPVDDSCAGGPRLDTIHEDR